MKTKKQVAEDSRKLNQVFEYLDQYDAYVDSGVKKLRNNIKTS